MPTGPTNLLRRLHDYVDTYISYLIHPGEMQSQDATAEMKRVISELETLQAHPDQQTETSNVADRISTQLEHLRGLSQQRTGRRPVSREHQSLGEAFRRYIDDEIEYIARSGGKMRRRQTNLLLGDIIADLKALSLNPDPEQAERLANDLEQRRAELAKLQRPWQKIGDETKQQAVHEHSM